MTDGEVPVDHPTLALSGEVPAVAVGGNVAVSLTTARRARSRSKRMAWSEEWTGGFHLEAVFYYFSAPGVKEHHVSHLSAVEDCSW